MQRWKIVGTSKSGNPVRITVRAKDYFEARKAAARTKMIIRDVVLVVEERCPNCGTSQYNAASGECRDAGCCGR